MTDKLFNFNAYLKKFLPSTAEKVEWNSDASIVISSKGTDDGAPLFNIEYENNDDLNLDGISEYGYSFWARWSRHSPEYIQKKAVWHSVARLTANRNHDDLKLGDRGLALLLGHGFYHFSAYSL